MNWKKKNIRKTSGTHKNVIKYDFCMNLPLGLKIKPIKKHKG